MTARRSWCAICADTPKVFVARLAPDHHHHHQVIKTANIMSQHPSQLPMELLLEVLETLLASGCKASHRTAAALAQSCRALRASQPGKRARYYQALASKSQPVPSRLPENLEYETEVLESSRWPHQPPAKLPSLIDSSLARQPVSRSVG